MGAASGGLELSLGFEPAHGQPSLRRPNDSALALANTPSLGGVFPPGISDPVSASMLWASNLPKGFTIWLALGRCVAFQLFHP